MNYDQVMFIPKCKVCITLKINLICHNNRTKKKNT